MSNSNIEFIGMTQAQKVSEPHAPKARPSTATTSAASPRPTNPPASVARWGESLAQLKEP